MTSRVFGPVASRRLGRSLGIDLVPFKTCSYDCIYCQLGRTTQQTTSRQPWVSLDEAIEQLTPMLSIQPDYITLSGSGEPTLFTPLDDVIGRIKQVTRIPVAVLTNGSMLWQPQVRKELRRADLVLPTLAAGDGDTFRRVHRPHNDLQFDQVVEGLARFREEFAGRYWLEVFLLAGINDSPQQIERLNRQIERIAPHRVQINTVVRPPAEEMARPLSWQRLCELAHTFSPPAQVIADFHSTGDSHHSMVDEEQILQLLRRRPCTAQDIANGLGLHLVLVVKCLDQLVCANRIRTCTAGSTRYYQASL